MAGDSMTEIKPKVVRTIDECAGHIRKRRPFRTRIRKQPYGTFVSMSGHSKAAGSGHVGNSIMDVGHLPAAYHPSYDMATYVVLSYDTPIAWWLPQPVSMDDLETVGQWLAGEDVGHWVIPDVRYTITTTQHQGEVRSALGGYAYHMRSWRETPEPIAYQHYRADGAPERVPYVGCERTAY